MTPSWPKSKSHKNRFSPFVGGGYERRGASRHAQQEKRPQQTSGVGGNAARLSLPHHRHHFSGAQGWRSGPELGPQLGRADRRRKVTPQARSSPPKIQEAASRRPSCSVLDKRKDRRSPCRSQTRTQVEDSGQGGQQHQGRAARVDFGDLLAFSYRAGPVQIPGCLPSGGLPKAAMCFLLMGD